MTDTTLSSPLAFYAAHGCALFPIPAGQKHGHLVPSFKHDFSHDPAQWARWQAEFPGCNFGVVAFASHWIIADTDTSGGDAGRVEAWAIRGELLASWGMDPATLPHCQSARGGWHDYFQVPPHIDASTLRQPDAIKKRINIRCVGFVVAAGSTFEGLPYTLFPDTAPPHPCPAALLAHCTRAERPATTSLPGSRDKGDVAALLAWLTERETFAAYEDWCAVGMALRLEYGDDGEELWALTHDATVTPDVAESKWQSFATEPSGASVTLASFLKRAHSLGWRGTVRPSVTSMFDGVAQIAAAAGASLSGSVPSDMMFAGTAEMVRLGAPYLDEFLAATADAPTMPLRDDLPRLPAVMEGHGLYAAMSACLVRISCLMAPADTKFKGNHIIEPMGVLRAMHPDTYAAVARRITLPERKIKLFYEGFAEGIERVTVTLDKWEYDAKTGDIQSDNPDNIEVFMGIVGCDVRRNTWTKRDEIKGSVDVLRWPVWTPIDGSISNALRMRAMRTKTRFKPTKDFFRDALGNLALKDQHDPVVEHIDSLIWDGVPRLSTWLSHACHVPCDPYHQVVGRNVIGGIVKRARKPGCKHDEVMILMGPQGGLKSSLCRILAMRDDWFTDSVSFEGSPQNIIPQLHGKLIIELAELDGMARKEVQQIKAFITRQNDQFTPKYEAQAQDNHRRSIFIGTSNEKAPLVDITGNRRFLPVRLNGPADLAWLRANVDQLVAEAAALEAAGSDFSIPPALWATAATYQEAARSVSDIEIALTDWFEETQYTGTAFVTVPDLAEACKMSRWNNANSLCHSIMPRLGFRQARPYIDGKRPWVWVRSTEAVRDKQIPGLMRYQLDTSVAGRVRFVARGPVPNR